ncbi:hypothetical protein WMY93_021062 [Mugilogobius chulae]|uniref:Uncharacterized protein n=1 Tax=Mugilogobius chulae TaxID=88201 RepID=A0AAW0NEI3_9GOBI
MGEMNPLYNSVYDPPPDMLPPSYNQAHLYPLRVEPYPGRDYQQGPSQTSFPADHTDIGSFQQPEWTNITFSDRGPRLYQDTGRWKHVFVILTVQMLVTFSFAALFTFVHDAKYFVQSNPWIYYTSYPAFVLALVFPRCCDGSRRKYPCNLVVLLFLSLSMMYMLGMIAAFHDTDIVIIAVGITAVVFFTVVLFTLQSKFAVSSCWGVLFACLAALICFGFLYIFIHHKILSLVFASLGALLFIFFLVVETHFLLGKKELALSSKEYIFEQSAYKCPARERPAVSGAARERRRARERPARERAARERAARERPARTPPLALKQTLTGSRLSTVQLVKFLHIIPDTEVSTMGEMNPLYNSVYDPPPDILPPSYNQAHLYPLRVEPYPGRDYQQGPSQTSFPADHTEVKPYPEGSCQKRPAQSGFPADPNALVCTIHRWNPILRAPVRKNQHSRACLLTPMVFVILTVQMLVTFSFAALFTFVHDAKYFVQSNPWIYYTSYPAFVVALVFPRCCDGSRRKYPCNLVVLSKFPVSSLWGVLFASLTGLMIFAFLCIFLSYMILSLVFASLGALLFIFFLMVETQLLLGKEELALSPKEYVFGALNLYQDNILLYIIGYAFIFALRGKRISDLESNAEDVSQRLANLDATCESLKKDNKQLKPKLCDLEGRSRRQNLRIVGLPESVEGPRPTVCETLPSPRSWIVPIAALCLNRVRTSGRVLSSSDSTAFRPRTS